MFGSDGDDDDGFGAAKPAAKKAGSTLAGVFGAGGDDDGDVFGGDNDDDLFGGAKKGGKSKKAGADLFAKDDDEDLDWLS